MRTKTLLTVGLLALVLALFVVAVLTVDWYAADTCSGLHVSGGDCVRMIGGG